jgi:hypothetical protein
MVKIVELFLETGGWMGESLADECAGEDVSFLRVVATMIMSCTLQMQR